MANYKERTRSKNNKQSTEIQKKKIQEGSPSQYKKAKQLYRIKCLVKKGRDKN
jgi:hypothetical protein